MSFSDLHSIKESRPVMLSVSLNLDVPNVSSWFNSGWIIWTRTVKIKKKSTETNLRGSEGKNPQFLLM